MHITTIVQNEIISIICSCLFFYLANIYRPSLGKVQFGWPNPNQSPLLNFYLKGKKKHSTQNCMNYNVMLPDFQFSFSFIFKKHFKKMYKKKSKFVTLYIVIINYYVFF